MYKPKLADAILCSALHAGKLNSHQEDQSVNVSDTFGVFIWKYIFMSLQIL